MRRLIGSMIALWVLLIAACAIALVVGRIAPSANPLQALGVSICDGVPCYRMLKAGVSWAQAQAMFPEATQGSKNIEFPRDAKTRSQVDIEKYNGVVDIVDVYTPFDKPMSVDAGDVIAEFGIPCRVVLLWVYEGKPNIAEIVYPTLLVDIDTAVGKTDNQHFYRFRLDSPIVGLIIRSRPDMLESCDEPPPAENIGSWYGFASANSYFNRNKFYVTPEAP